MLQNPQTHISAPPPGIEASVPVSTEAVAFAPGEQGKRESTLTLLILKDGRAYLASEYWFEDGQRIRFTLADGALRAIAIESLDYARTTEINRERGVPFVIRSDKIEQKD